MKKIKIILCIMLFLTPTICFAKEIKIDRTSYNVDDVLELNGLIYDSKSDTITLNNANLISIQTNEDLKIIVNGENTLNNDMSVSSCIRGNHVTIEGNGTLNLISNSKGISANKLDINNATIFGDVFTSMFVLTGNDPSMSINNSNVVFKDSEAAFYILNGSVNINDSNVIIEKTASISGESLNSINLNNSTFDVIESTRFAFDNLGIINIDSNSKIFMYLKNGLDSKYFDGQDIKYLGSIDNINYHENIASGDLYLKVISSIDLESEKINLEREKEQLQEAINQVETRNRELDYLESQNNIKEQELNNKELELLELDEGLNKKEEELMTKETNLNTNSMNLDARESSIEALSNLLMGKQDEVKTLENSIEKEKLEIDSLKRYLNLKEKELHDKETKLLMKNEDGDLAVEEEKTYYGNEGVLEDDLLENTFESHETNPNSISKLGNLFYLLISYIGGIITHIFTKRRING